MLDLWFGDSYSVGSELGSHYGSSCLDQEKFNNHNFGDLTSTDFKICKPELAFPHLVSENYINLGANNTGIEYCLWKLHNYLLRGKRADRAFFGLSSMGRRTIVSDNGQVEKREKRSIFSGNDDLERLHYESVNITNSLYFLCKEYEIKPYFFPLWKPVEFGVWSIFSKIPQENWLVKSSSAITWEAWNLDEPIINWKKHVNHPAYQKYVYPCLNHPNIEGHKEIAKFIKENL